MALRDVVILSGVRTPLGMFLGAMKDVPAQTFGARILREAVRRAGIEDRQIDEVILGNLGGSDCHGNIARETMLEASMPIEIPAYTVCKNCASAMKAVALAATSIRAGEADVIIAGGIESMSRFPYMLNGARTGLRFGHATMYDYLAYTLEGMGLTAERLAEKYKIGRQEQDAFAYHSQMKAVAAQQAGRFDEQIVPIEIPQKKGDPIVFNRDEGVKPQTTIEALAKLRTVFKEGGTVTAGNASTINDGGAALVLASAEKASELGLRPWAKIAGYASAGCEPEIMGIGPVPATKRLLAKLGRAMTDFDLLEINEAFAVQAMSVLRELPAAPERVNVNGGAIALGHPVGATGAILVVKLIHEMRRRNVATGLANMCIGGGQGMAIALENIG
jgi:acetyl-CoA C-acetyltransferase